MGPDTSRTIALVLEGLPCGGKTSLLRALGGLLPHARLIGEVGDERCAPVSTRAEAIRNDQAKSRLMAESRGTALVDRYYYTSVAYEIALREPRVEVAAFEAEYRTMFDVDLLQPTHLVIVPISVAASLAQLHRRDGPDPRSPWRSPTFLECLVRFYAALATAPARWSRGHPPPRSCVLDESRRDHWAADVVEFLDA